MSLVSGFTLAVSSLLSFKAFGGSTAAVAAASDAFAAGVSKVFAMAAIGLLSKTLLVADLKAWSSLEVEVLLSPRAWSIISLTVFLPFSFLAWLPLDALGFCIFVS